MLRILSSCTMNKEPDQIRSAETCATQICAWRLKNVHCIFYLHSFTSLDFSLIDYLTLDDSQLKYVVCIHCNALHSRLHGNCNWGIWSVTVHSRMKSDATITKWPTCISLATSANGFPTCSLLNAEAPDVILCTFACWDIGNCRAEGKWKPFLPLCSCYSLARAWNLKKSTFPAFRSHHKLWLSIEMWRAEREKWVFSLIFPLSFVIKTFSVLFFFPRTSHIYLFIYP